MSNDTRGRPDLLSHVSIVLVGTSHPGNIGAAARAMKNMGLQHLVLVSPDSFPHPDADSRASGAGDVLSGARVVSSLAEALADRTVVFGASARQRTLPWPVVEPAVAANGAMAAAAQAGRVAFVFGREDSGLSNDELQRCHYHVQIPTVDGFSSLNLAMAVQVISYELRLELLGLLEKARGKARPSTRSADLMLSPRDEGWDVELASMEEVDQFLIHLEQVLVEIEFHDPERPRQLLQRLRRLFLRAHPDRMEINILRGVLRNVQRKAAISDGNKAH